VFIATGYIGDTFYWRKWFFNQIASKFHDGRAAFLQKRLLELEPVKFQLRRRKMHISKALFGAFPPMTLLRTGLYPL